MSTFERQQWISTSGQQFVCDIEVLVDCWRHLKASTHGKPAGAKAVAASEAATHSEPESEPQSVEARGYSAQA